VRRLAFLIALSIGVPLYASTLTTPSTLVIQSAPGDKLGGGKTYSYISDPGIVDFSRPNTAPDHNGDTLPDGFLLEVRRSVASVTKEDWDFTFLIGSSAPKTDVTKPATYQLTDFGGDLTNKKPWMTIFFNGQACHVLPGSTLRIDEIGYRTLLEAVDFEVTRLKAHFSVTCLGSTGRLTGDIDYDASAPDGTDLGGTPTSTPSPTPTPTPAPQPPTSTPIVVLSDDVRANPLTIGNVATTTVPFSTFVPDATTGPVTLSAASDADDLFVTVTPQAITSKGSIDGVASIRTTATTTAGNHAVTLTATSADGTASSATIFVTVLCDPPFILGIDQPKNATVSSGRSAQLSVKASGSGPFTYQWFTGASGLSNFPLPGGTSANFTTSALNDTTSYWVRVTNACGSVNSQTATVNVSAGAKPTRQH